MQQGAWSEVTAIASKDIKDAEYAAQALEIPKAYLGFHRSVKSRKCC